jgi:hypothetical protein
MELENIKNLSYNFFEKLLIKIDEIIVIEEEIEVLNIKIKTPDSSLVI